MFIWNNELNANASSPSTNYWNSSTSSTPAERLKQPDKKPMLMSEDSMEGGIDSGMMSELEKNLVDIVEVWSNPDDSGIKLD